MLSLVRVGAGERGYGECVGDEESAACDDAEGAGHGRRDVTWVGGAVCPRRLGLLEGVQETLINKS